MSLKDTYKNVRELLNNITMDLEKAENGNKAASQRVRTGTVRLEKLAKLYRKESISSEKKNKGQKKPTKTASKSTKASSTATSSSKGKSSSESAKSHKSTSSSSKSTAKVKAKPKAKSTKASVRPRQLSVKRATAKLPTKRVSTR